MASGCDEREVGRFGRPAAGLMVGDGGHVPGRATRDGVYRGRGCRDRDAEGFITQTKLRALENLPNRMRGRLARRGGGREPQIGLARELCDLEPGLAPGLEVEGDLHFTETDRGGLGHGVGDVPSKVIERERPEIFARSLKDEKENERRERGGQEILQHCESPGRNARVGPM